MAWAGGRGQWTVAVVVKSTDLQGTMETATGTARSLYCSMWDWASSGVLKVVTQRVDVLVNPEGRGARGGGGRCDHPGPVPGRRLG